MPTMLLPFFRLSLNKGSGAGENGTEDAARPASPKSTPKRFSLEYMPRLTRTLVVVVLLTSTLGCGTPEPAHLTIYSGRAKSLVDPLVEKFRTDTAIAVDVRYGDTAELAVALTEEGVNSRADLFWAQDAGALGAVAAAGLLASLPDSILDRVPEGFRSREGRWVATSARARTLAYSTARVTEAALPQSIFDLIDPKYKGLVGWAPANGSFQAFVTAMRQTYGDDRTRQWLVRMRDNGAQSYPKNTAILQGIANGEIDFGLPNHYYLFRFTSEDPDFPVAQTHFREGDIGNLVNVAGLGVLASSQSPSASLRFIGYVLSESSQQYFRTETFEYPVVTRSGTDASGDSIRPSVNLDSLRDLEQTLDMLRSAGLL